MLVLLCLVRVPPSLPPWSGLLPTHLHLVDVNLLDLGLERLVGRLHGIHRGHGVLDTLHGEVRLPPMTAMP